MKKIFLFVAIAILFLQFSVQKAETVKYRIKKKTSEIHGQVFSEVEYFYDLKGRILTQIEGPDTMRFIYDHDTVWQKGKYTGLPTMEVKYVLNSAGLAVTDNLKKVYMYDENNFLISSIYPNGNFISHTISDGDIISTTFALQGRQVIDCTFYPDPDNSDLGQGFLGNQNTHLVKMEVVTRDDNTDTLKYTYKFDKLGRVAKSTYVRQPSPGIFDTTTVSYSYY